MNEDNLSRWFALKTWAARGNMWAQEDRAAYIVNRRYAAVFSANHVCMETCRETFINWSAYSADKTATAMFYMGITEEDQYYA